MRPDSVGPHVCAVEVCLGVIKDHAVNGGLGAIFVVLDVLVQSTFRVHGEDVAISGVVVEGVAVDVVRGLLGGKEEDGAGLCVGVVGLWVTAHRVRGRMDNVCRTIYSKAVPFLHGRTVDVLLGVLCDILDQSCARDWEIAHHTSNAIHEIGSS